MPDRFRVLATSALHPDAEALLRKTCDFLLPDDASPDALRRAVRDADALIVRAKLPDDIFDHAPRLRACVRHGIGLDFIPVEAATRALVAVANLPTANIQAVIEYTAGVIVVVMRDLHRVAAGFAAGGWKSRAGLAGGFELAGKTLGIVGTGKIGTGVGKIMGAGFGMRVLGYDKLDERDVPGMERVPLDVLLAGSDVVTLHVPSTPETRGMLDARRIGLMKPGAVLVNAARGDLVDEAALIAALGEGRLSGAAVDVFEPEPLPDDHPFHGVPNLFLTPHIAGLTVESSRRMSVEAAEEALRILAGTRPLNLVNPEVWDACLEKWR